MPSYLQHFFFLLIHISFFFQPLHIDSSGNGHHYKPTPTPTATIPATPTQNPTPTTTPKPTSSPTPTPTKTPTPTDTPTPSLTVTPTATNTPTPTVTPTATSTPTPTPTGVIGNDISYPQCTISFPTGQAFGIVGVNGGIASTTNPCLSNELTWANASTGLGNQIKIQLYVNTANPGGLNTATWPKNNIDPAGTVTTNPYGTCDGSDSLACAYQYGWNRAVEDVSNRFAPAAQSAGIATDPANYPWWLDVETANTWKSRSDSAYQSNAADLEGMVAYFQSKSITVGIYSTVLQWGDIINNQGSKLSGLNNWLPGAQDLTGAEANCSATPFTSGSKITLTQYTSGNFDYDYFCE